MRYGTSAYLMESFSSIASDFPRRNGDGSVAVLYGGKWQEFLVSLDLLGGVPADRAAYLRCLYALSNHPEAHYRTLSVPKRGGGRRTLREPDALLKKVQKNILRHILAGAPVSEYACAYRKGTGVRQNAAIHLGQPMILKLDIHDFSAASHFPW